MGTDSSKDTPKIDFHTKIWPRDHRLVKELALKYGNIQNVIEEAIQLLRIRESLRDPKIMKKIKKNKIDLYPLSHLMLQDRRMVAVGRTTFSSFIESIPDSPIKDNNASELIEWFYDNKSLDHLSLLEILQAIRSLWISGNYFKQIDIQPLNDYPHAYKIIFSHDFDKNYGIYWTQYFQYFLTHDPLNFKIENIAIHHERFRMEIYESSPRIKPQSTITPKITPEGW